MSEPQNMMTGAKLFLTLVLLLLLCFGLLCIQRGLKKRKRCSATVPATVVAVTEQYRFPEEIQRKQETVRYVEWEYAVTGTRYRSREAASGRKTYRVGDTVPVRCNPENPEEVLLPNEKLYIGAGAGIVLLAATAAATAFLI